LLSEAESMLLASQRWQTESAKLIGVFNRNAGPEEFVAELALSQPMRRRHSGERLRHNLRDRCVFSRGKPADANTTDHFAIGCL